MTFEHKVAIGIAPGPVFVYKLDTINQSYLKFITDR